MKYAKSYFSSPPRLLDSHFQTKKTTSPMEKCKAKLPMSLLGKSRLLIWLSLLLFTGYGAQAQLDCGNVLTTISPGQSFVGTTIAQPNNVIDYCNFDNNGWTGPETIHRIEWPGGDLTATLNIFPRNNELPNLDLILLSGCNDAGTCIDFETRGEDGNSNTDKLVLNEGNLAQGTYYLVVDGRSGESGSYSLQTNVPPSGVLDCGSAIPISVGSSVSGTTVGKPNNREIYCDVTGFSGPEVLYKVNWEGGRMRFLLEVDPMSNGEFPFLVYALLNDCQDPNSCINKSTGDYDRFPSVSTLAPGTYYILIDGFNEATASYTLSIEKEELDCANAATLQVGQPYDGDTRGGANNVSRYCEAGPEDKAEAGPEVVHEINWPGGDFTATMDITGVPFQGEELRYPDLDLILLNDCNDITSCVNVNYGTDNQEKIEQPNLPAGTYYLVVDGKGQTAASREGAYTLTVEGAALPDYAVTELSVDQDPIIPGEGFVVSYKVENIGTARGDIYRFLQFLSTDNVLNSNEDIKLADFATAALNPGGEFGGSPTRTIPSSTPPGNYFLITAVFPEGEDANEDNNIKILPVTVGALGLDCANAIPLQHLVKTQGSFTNAANNVTDYGRGGNFTGREVVYSIDLPSPLWFQGNVYFDITGDVEKVILLNSCDPIEVYPGPYVDKGTAQVINGVDQGTYYIVVEGPLDGSDGNFELTVRRDHLGCTEAEPITIGQPTGPGATAYDYVNHYCGNPNTAALTGNEAVFEFNWPGGDFRATLSDMVRGNSGDAWEDAALILLTDCQDPATCVADPIINNGASELVLNVANLPAGNYTIVVDGASPEPSPEFTLTINEEAKPDYAVTELSVDQDPIIPGEGFVVSYKVENIGAARGDIYRFLQFLSTDNVISNEDIELADFATAALNPGGEFGGSPTRTISSSTPPGNYFLITAVFPEGEDANQDNNIKVIEVRVGADQKPDYQPTDMTGPASATPGQNITMQVTLKNDGGDLGPNDDITNGKDKYYISNRSDLTAANVNGQATFLAEYDTDDIPSGEIREYPGGITIPTSVTPGQYYIYFFHDADDNIDESNEDNNVISWPITIETATPKPDYAVTELSVDQDPIIPGEGFVVSYKVENIGAARGDIYRFLQFLSTDNVISNEDIELADFATAALNPGGEFGGSPTRTISSSTPPGNYFLITAVFPEGEDANQDNNIKVIEVRVGNISVQRPDYQPTDFRARGEATTLQAGGTLIIDLKINNNGPVDGLGNGGKDKYYLNTSPDLSGNPIFLRDFGTANIPANSNFDVNSGPLNIPANTAPGTYYIVFFHDADDIIDESDEDNNIAYLQIEVVAPGSGLNVDFSANQSTICEGESIQFTSTVSASENTVYDQSGSGNNGDLKNFASTPYESRANYGQAINLDGSDDYIELPEGITSNLDNFTLESWYYYEERKIWQRIMDFGAGTSKYIMLTPSGSTGAPMFEIRGPSGRPRLISPDELTIGNWYHFAAVIDGATKTAKLYVNGQLKAEESIIDLPSDLGVLNQNWLGKSQWPDPGLKGKLDEVRIWSTARTQQQIQANKDRALTGNEAGLVAYYDFNQEVGNAANYTWTVEKDGNTFSTSSEVAPSFTFDESGTYRISLTVTSDGQTASEVKEGYIFVEDCSAPEWPVIPTGDNHLVIVPSNADITLDGASIAVGDYIGAFYNDNGTLKCAGKAQWTGENLSIIVYGDDLSTSEKEGIGVGESFQWKLWKASTAQELYGTATYLAPTGIITHMGQFAVNGVSSINRMTGTTQPQQTASQTIILKPGWNLVSSYIKSDAQNMAAIFEPIKSSIAIAKNGSGDVYMPAPFINDIGNWNVTDGYQVKVLGNTDLQLTLTGEKVDPSTSISLDEGYNLFAYLKETEQAVQTVMAPIASEVQIIKDALGRAYIPSLSINHIGNMKPGQGYWAQMNGAATLSYNARMATPPANMHTAQFMPTKYSITRRGTDNATMILDTKDLVAYGDEVGVFDKAGNLVGAATYEDHLLAFTIWGDDPTTDEIDGLEEGDEFEIRVWNKATQTEDVLEFTADVEMYTTHGVIQAELLRTTNVSSLLEANSLKLYPNPTRDNATLSLELTSQASVQATLFDLTGKRVLDIVNENMPTGIHQLKISTDQLPAGLYHCQIVVDGHPHNIQLSVVK